MRILSRPAFLEPFDASQLEAMARLIRSAQGLGFTVGFVFLGFGSAIFAWLFLRGGYVPRWMARWGLVASSWFGLCALAAIVFPAAVQTLQIVSFAPMGLYEVGLGLWLWTRGADLQTVSVVDAHQ